MLFLYIQLGMISNSVLYSHWSLNIVSIAAVIWAHFPFPQRKPLETQHSLNYVTESVIIH